MAFDPLSIKISELKTSQQFLEMSQLNGFISLGDFTKHTITELLKKPGMNYRMLVELSNFLKSYDLLSCLKEV